MPTSFYTAFVSCLEGGAIDVFRGDPVSDRVELVQTIPLSGKGLPLARSPDGRRLYASTFNVKDGVEEARIDAFEVDPATGLLTQSSSTVVPARMVHISVDRSGRFLLGASFQSNLIAAFPIGGGGRVHSTSSCTIATPLKAHHTLTDHSNRFVYVPCLGSDLVMCLTFDEETGTFHDNDPPAVQLQKGAGCRQVAFHPNRRHLYLLNEVDGSMVAYRLDPDTGRLAEIMRDSFADPGLQGSPWGAQVHVSLDGTRLFASERRGSTLCAWVVDRASGQFMHKQIINTGRNPRGFALTPDGRRLLLGALDDDRLEIYDVSDTSQAPRKLCDLPTSKQPGWVEIM